MNLNAAEAPDAEPTVQEQVEPVAGQTLEYFEVVGHAAEAALDDRVVTLDTLMPGNALMSDAAQRSLDTFNQEKRDDLRTLSREPAIARIVVSDETGEHSTIFIARAAPFGSGVPGSRSASYRSPIGRLAALGVGEELDVPTPRGEKSYRVVTRAALRPERTGSLWDARNTVFESESAGPVTVVSLRAVIDASKKAPSDLDVLDALLASGAEATNIIDGLARTVVEKMGLRDQPLLDRYQDEIFRLPLDRRLAILGPPGAGKTTTLIKRLGLKLDTGFLDPDETAQVARTFASGAGHPASWMMFTPTELLKQYIKEAFAREDIAASDLRIQTWTDYRLNLGRRELGILRTSTGGGAVMRAGPGCVAPATLVSQIEWFNDFEGHQRERFWEELAEQAAILSLSTDLDIAAIGQRLASLSLGDDGGSTAAALLTIDAMAADIAAKTALLRAEVDSKTRASLAAHVGRDKNLLDDLAAFVKRLGDSVDVLEEGDELDLEDEEDEDTGIRRNDREIAFEAYRRVSRVQARAAVLKRSVGRRTRNGKILEWLGDRTLSDEQKRDIGQQLLTLGALRKASNPVKRYVSGMLQRYRRFRRERQVGELWYSETAVPASDLSPVEVDLVILATLRAARTLLVDRQVQRRIDNPSYGILRTVRELYRNQLVVDEATDFSPIQLACMAQLTDPALESFVLCGDFNQRITVTGARSEADLTWIFPDLEVKPITVTYRHSRPLAQLSEALVGLSGGISLGARLPDHLVTDGFAPVLATGLQGGAEVEWLAQRIREIDQHLSGRIPSIAILVNSEAEVMPLAEALDEALAASNIRCTPCPGGQVRGQDSEVRVFDVQHIKGLEFEAVFFVGIDALAAQQPELFDKFLYVGATRAATYLGLTCVSDRAPDGLSSILSMFRTEWVAA